MSDVALDVGFVCQGWSPERGGVETHTFELARGLRERGHRVHVLCLDRGANLTPYSTRVSEVDGVDVRRLAYRYHDQRALADLAVNDRAEQVLTAWLAEVPCDVVHVHHVTGFGAGALRALHELGRAFVVTLHDYWLVCPRGQMWSASGELCSQPLASVCGPCLARTWPHLMPSMGGEARGPDGAAAPDDEQAAARRTRFAVAQLAHAQRLLVPSRSALEPFVRVGLEPHLFAVCEHGLDHARIARETTAARAAHPRPAGDLVRLGVLGSVLPTKGVLELIEAFRAADAPRLALEIHGDLPSYHGDTAYARQVRELAASSARVTLHGPYAHEQLGSVLASLDGVAAPAFWNEVYGLSVREARAAGLPVLVSDAGGLPAAAQEGRAGLVLPARGREAWSRALERFASDSAARAAWAATPHGLRGLADMAAEVEGHYRAALSARSSERASAAPPPAKAGFLRRLFGR